MSMSTHVAAVIPPDQQWKKMKAVWDACNAADLLIPKEVEKFFNYETPDDAGVVVDLSGMKPHECCREWGKNASSGYERSPSYPPT